MMLTSPKKFAGGEEMGTVGIDLGKDAAPALVRDVYQKIRSLKDEAGQPYVSGHTTSGGKMVILNDGKRIATNDLYKKIGALLGERYDVAQSTLFAQFPEKGEDSYGLSRQGQAVGLGTGPSLRRAVDTLRRDAAARLEREIAKREPGKASEGEAGQAAEKSVKLQRASDEKPAKPFFSQLTRQVENLKPEIVQKPPPGAWIARS